MWRATSDITWLRSDGAQVCRDHFSDWKTTARIRGWKARGPKLTDVIRIPHPTRERGNTQKFASAQEAMAAVDKAYPMEDRGDGNA